MKLFYCSILTLALAYLPAKAQDHHHGGGAHHFEHGACISEAERVLLHQEVKSNIDELIQEGLLSEEKSSNSVAFRWPVEQTEGFNYNSAYAVSYFVDHDPTPGIQDYDCGNRSYNGHRGTDIFLWPYWWRMVEANQVAAVAASAGTIVWKKDGEYSYNCALSFGTPWNAIFVRHADNSISWYGHLKEGSLTEKGLGDTVEEGEYLGIIASSGSSTAPHLHFEVYDSDNNLLDPFQGSCNSINSESLWQDQRGYREPTLNTIMTHSAAPTFTECVDAENPVDNYVSNCFDPGNLIYFASYFHDQMEGEEASYTVYRPDNSIEWEWVHASPETHDASWWFWTRALPSNAMSGSWTYEVAYNGETISHIFEVGGASISSNIDEFEICEGNSLTLTASEGISYIWSTGETEQQIEVSTAGSYSVTVSSSNGCESQTFEYVEVYPAPEINAIDGVLVSNPGIIDTYSIDGAGNSTYSWTVEGGNIIGESNSTAIDIEWLEVESGQVCLQETNVNGCQSEIYCIDVELILTSLDEIASLKGFSVFPNPTNQQFQVQLNLAVQVPKLQLKLHNSVGQVIYQYQENRLPSGVWQKAIDIDQLPSGVYWLSAYLGDQVISEKIIAY